MKKYYIIGCGGVGSWLAPSLCLLLSPKDVVLVDGDKLEKKNLNRQLFEESAIGQHKAMALAKKYGCTSINEWFHEGTLQCYPNDWLFVCVDNNAARMAALAVCDRTRCRAIFAANETTSSEAYIYLPQWKGTGCDPRVYYASMVDDDTENPLRPEGCTGEAQVRNPQLVTANSMAAGLAANLFVLWGIKGHTITRESIPMMPHKLNANISRLETHRIENKLTKERTEHANGRNHLAGATVG